MRNKVIWLSLLGLALAMPSKEIKKEPSTVSEDTSKDSSDQRQRSSRSIWPFGSSASATEAPVTYPPSVNNDWFVNGETALPEGIDLKKYPVWKIHKYHGIDIRPVVKVEDDENIYPPDGVAVNAGVNSGAITSVDTQTAYQSGFQDFLTSHNGQTEGKTQGSLGTYPPEGQSFYPAPKEQPHYPPAVEEPSYPPATGQSFYPPAEQTTYPQEVQSYNSGEFLSTDYRDKETNGEIRSHQQYFPYAPPVDDPIVPHLTYGVPEPQRRPQLTYGVPERNRVVQNINVQSQNYAEQGQNQFVQQQSSTGSGDLGFLDNLGGLADLLPEPEEVTEKPGFFQSLISKFRGTSESPLVVEESVPVEPVSSGGFLSSLFGQKQNTEEYGVPDKTESSGGVLSSLFRPKEPETPEVPPTTYYLPETRGSYIAVKVPAGSGAGFKPNLGPYGDIPNIQVHEAPRVPFGRQEIPSISTPTLDSGYNHYKLGESEIRNSGRNRIEATKATVSSGYGIPDNYREVFLPVNAVSEVTGVQQSNVNQGQTKDLGNNNYIHSKYQIPDDYEEVLLPVNGASEVTEIQQSNVNEAKITDFKNTEVAHSEYQIPNNYQEVLLPVNPVSEVASVHQSNLNQAYITDIGNTKVKTSGQSQITTNQFRPSGAYQIHIQASNDQNNFESQQSYHRSTTTTRDQTQSRSKIQSQSQSQGQGHSQSRNQFAEHNLNGQVLDLNHNFQPPRETPSTRTPAPLYQIPASAFQTPKNPLQPTEHYDSLPVHEAEDFRKTSSFDQQSSNQGANNQDLSALTSYGTLTSSYKSEPFVGASSDVQEVVVPETSDNDKESIGEPTETSESKNPGKKVRKVLRRRKLTEKAVSRRSSPERQAPTEEVESAVFRSEKDLVPDAREGRNFDGTEVTYGYSKVQQNHDPDVER